MSNAKNCPKNAEKKTDTKTSVSNDESSTEKEISAIAQTEDRQIKVKDWMLAIAISVTVLFGAIIYRYLTTDDVPQPEPVPAPSPEPVPPTPLPDGVSLDGPSTATVGDMVIMTIHGCDKAGWAISPQTVSYCDSNTTALVFVPQSATSHTVLVSAVDNGEPIAVAKVITVKDRGQSDDSEPTPDNKNDSLENWISRNLPNASGEYKNVSAVFSNAHHYIENGSLITEAGVWSYLNGHLKGACSADIWNDFLSGLTDRIKKEYEGKNVRDMSRVMERVAKSIK